MFDAQLHRSSKDKYSGKLYSHNSPKQQVPAICVQILFCLAGKLLMELCEGAAFAFSLFFLEKEIEKSSILWLKNVRENWEIIMFRNSLACF